MTDNDITDIRDWYVQWANTLDSAGRDSSEVRARLRDRSKLLDLSLVLRSLIHTSRATDKMKKHLFYGKDYNRDNSYQELQSQQSSLQEVYNKLDNHNTIRLLHAILGMIDEVGELTQALYEYLYHDKELDLTNLREELGDSQWYHAVLAKFLGDEDFVPTMEANYRKLTARYPEGTWNKVRSLDRDLDKEREALEDKKEE